MHCLYSGRKSAATFVVCPRMRTMEASPGEGGVLNGVVPRSAYFPDLRKNSDASFLKFSSKRYQTESFHRARRLRTTRALKRATTTTTATEASSEGDSASPTSNSTNTSLHDLLQAANLKRKRLNEIDGDVAEIYQTRLRLFPRLVEVYLENKTIRDGRFGNSACDFDTVFTLRDSHGLFASSQVYCHGQGRELLGWHLYQAAACLSKRPRKHFGFVWRDR